MTVVDDDGNKHEVPRQTAAMINDKDGKIYIDSKYFKLSSQARRDAVLQHEIGHTKFHSLNPKSNKMDKEMMSKEMMLSSFENQIKTINDQGYGYKESDPEFKELRKDILHDFEPLIKKYAGKIPNDNSGRQKIRAEARAILKKYEKSGHANTNEFEADRYSANKTSKKDIKSGVREYYKLQRKEDAKNISSYVNSNMETRKEEFFPRSKKEIREEGKRIRSYTNKTYQEDMNQRSKALNDKSLTVKQKQNYK